MEIKIDEQVLSEAVKKSVGEALSGAASGWEIKQAIQKAAAEAITAAGLVEQVAAALAREVDEQAGTIVSQVAHQVAPVLAEVLRTSALRNMARLLVRMRNTSYVSEGDETKMVTAEVARIEQRLAGGEVG